MSSKPKYEVKDTPLGERVVINGYVILTMPLRVGAMAGRTHTASCTLCRDRLIAQGHQGGSALGALGFFRNEHHRDSIVGNHLKLHENQGDLMYVVHLPPRVRLMTLEDEVKNGSIK